MYRCHEFIPEYCKMVKIIIRKSEMLSGGESEEENGSSSEAEVFLFNIFSDEFKQHIIVYFYSSVSVK